MSELEQVRAHSAGVSVQFQSKCRAVLCHFQSSCTAIFHSFPSNFRAIFIQFPSSLPPEVKVISVRFQSTFRAVPEQFPASCFVPFLRRLSPDWRTFRRISPPTRRQFLTHLTAISEQFPSILRAVSVQCAGHFGLGSHQTHFRTTLKHFQNTEKSHRCNNPRAVSEQFPSSFRVAVLFISWLHLPLCGPGSLLCLLSCVLTTQSSFRAVSEQLHQRFQQISHHFPNNCNASN